MKFLREIEDLVFIVKNKSMVFIGEFGKEVRPVDPKEFVNMPIGELLLLISNEKIFYDEDPGGAKTLVIRKFDSFEEAKEYAKNTNWEDMKKELEGQYGKVRSAYVDGTTLELCITRFEEPEKHN